MPFIDNLVIVDVARRVVENYTRNGLGDPRESTDRAVMLAMHVLSHQPWSYFVDGGDGVELLFDGGRGEDCGKQRR